MYPGRSVRSATRPCQECGDHETPRTTGEMYEKFIKPLKLEDKYDFWVNGSYWTAWKRDRLRLFREPALRDCAAEGKWEFQKAQVLRFVPMWLESEDGANSPVSFLNLHLPCICLSPKSVR